MQEKILTEKLLKEAARKACEAELRMCDELIAAAEKPVFSDEFEEKMKKITEKK